MKRSHIGNEFKNVLMECYAGYVISVEGGGKLVVRKKLM